MGFDVSEVDHWASVMTAAPAQVAIGSGLVVRTTLEAIHDDAQEFAPVLTGELRDGIVTEFHGLSGSVISTAGHSEYVEDGTSDTAPQPFMRPAADRNEPIFAEALLDVAADAL